MDVVGADGQHHYIELSQVVRVDGGRLRLSVLAQEAMQ
jgi:hypothetical protein